MSEKRANTSATPFLSHSVRRQRISPSSDSIDIIEDHSTRRSRRPSTQSDGNPSAGPSGTKRRRSTTPPSTSQRPVSRLQQSPDITIVSGYLTSTSTSYHKGNIRSSSPDIMVLNDKRPPSPSVAAVGESDVNKKRSRALSGFRSGSATMMRDESEERKDVFFELFSEDDITVPEPPAKRKKFGTTPNLPIQRSHSPIEFSSGSENSDDDWDHPGLGLSDPNVWLPTPTNVNRLEMPELSENDEDLVSQKIDQLSLIPTSPPRQRWRIHPDTSRWSSTPPATSPSVYVWDKLRLAQNIHFRPRPRPIMMEFSRKTITRPKDADFNMHRLKVARSVKQAPGTINVIEQRGVRMVLGSACAGGLADVPDESRNPYNRSGSLTAWTDGPEILDAHKKSKGQWIKYYTVNDVKFNPINDSFASTGEDKKLRLWTLPEGENVRWKVDLCYEYCFAPHNLAFRPGSEILAVAEKQVFLYDLTDETVREYRFQMHDRLSPHVIGSMAWGNALTADHLFVSSEPTQKTFTGAHKVYDLGAQKEAYGFDVKEAGDSIAVDPTGSMLALCTQAEPSRHILRLYDVQRRNSNAIISLDIVPFRTRLDDFEGEVNVAVFSPDGLYLALSRNDNRTHVYDRRMLGKRREATPLFDYAHTGEPKMASRSEAYGVVNAEWVQSEWTRRVCLVTGGEDGCVRMWDPAKAVDDSENGKILAEVNNDVSQFSVGDPFAEEHRLVVGDASGEVTIFDNIIV